MIALADYKDALKLKHYQETSRSYGEAVERAWRAWSAYEQVNRDYAPDDPVYSVTRAGVALVTTADTYTFIAAAAGQVRFLEIIWGGEATASAVNRIAHQRSTVGTTGATGITPEKFNTRSPTAATVVWTAWTAQPTLSGNPWLLVPINAFGGYVDWKAAPGEEFYIVNAEQMSVRSQSGTSLFSSTIIFEEL